MTDRIRRDEAHDGENDGRAPVADRDVRDLVYLMSCGLNGVAASAARVGRMASSGALDGRVRALATAHQVLTLCAAALRTAGPLDAAWASEENARTYRLVMFAVERDAVLADLGRRGIRHMPLKGSVLAGWYPSATMREMCDVDVLVEPGSERAVRDVMLARGFSPLHVGGGHDDSYARDFLNFEMHHHLFGTLEQADLAAYYEDVWDRLEPDPAAAEPCAWRMRDEDFYAYVTLHAFKHYVLAGFGLRTLADEAVLTRRFADAIDWDDVQATVAAFGAGSFERTLRSLATLLFDPALLAGDGAGLDALLTAGAGAGLPAEKRTAGADSGLPAEEWAMLVHVVASGTYGTTEQATRQRVLNEFGENPLAGERNQISDAHRSKLSYLLRRVFPAPRWMRDQFPVLKGAGIVLLPGAYVFRIARAAATKRGAISTELAQVREVDAHR